MGKKKIPGLILGLALAWLGNSCSLLQLDVFPSYLGNATAMRSFDEVLRSLEIDPTGGSVNFMVFLDGSYQGSSYRYLGVVWSHPSKGPIIFFFDGDTLAYRNYLTSTPGGAYLGVWEDGSIISGAPSVYSSSAYAIVEPFTFFKKQSGFFNSTTSFSRAWVVYDSQSNTCTVVPSYLSLVDLFTMGNTLQFLIKDTVDNVVIPYSRSNINVSYHPRIPLENDGRAWVSAGGVITVRQERGLRLFRYSFSDGARIDEFALPYVSNGDMAFAPDGKRWALYDRDRRRLYLLRSWW